MSEIQLIRINHNCEMAHRLFTTPGRCQAIHGHSWMVELALSGPVDHTGKLAGIEYGELKKAFRGHLDREYDHRVLLFEGDPWAGALRVGSDLTYQDRDLPGLQRFPCDPTTENFARIIGEWALEDVVSPEIDSVEVGVYETRTNYANWRWTK